MVSLASPTSSVKSQASRLCSICSSFLCKWQEHDECVLHYSSGYIRGGSCLICKDWTKEMWLRSDAQRDKQLAKLVDRTVSKKAKASAKETPSHSVKVTPRKTVVSPKSLTKLSARKKSQPAKRRVYQATLDKLRNIGKFSHCQNNENNGNYENIDNDPNNVESKVIFPIIGNFALTTVVVFPTYFPGGLAPTNTTTDVV